MAIVERGLVLIRSWDLVWLQAHPHSVFLLSGLCERLLVLTWWIWQLLGLG